MSHHSKKTKRTRIICTETKNIHKPIHCFTLTHNLSTSWYFSVFEDQKAKGDTGEGEGGARGVYSWDQVGQVCVVHQLQWVSIQED